MRNDPFKSMSDAACRSEIMSSLGHQLRTIYSCTVSDPVPERMQELVRRIDRLEYSHSEDDGR